MGASIRQVHPLFFAEISGVDLTEPSEELRRIVQDAMDKYAVCVIPGQIIDDAQQVAFSRLFGQLEIAPNTRGDKIRSPHPEIWNVTNLDKFGGFQKETDASRQYRLGNQLWHTDSSFRQVAGMWSMLSAKLIPPRDADTEFADCRAAYDALPQTMKARIEGLRCEHNVWYSRSLKGGYTPTEEERKQRPPAFHPLVRTIPGSGRKALYLASHVRQIVGWDFDESRKLLDELMEFATQPQFVHAHKWSVGDLVIWDNRCTMHRATPFEDNVYARDMRRTTVREMAAAE
jgi:alpha-ketoglutarate-dependent 2,4-dichlorophenoxyacetate dioxygenase